MKMKHRLVSWYNNRRFRTKILLAFLLVAIIPFMALWGYVVMQKRTAIEADEINIMEKLLNNCRSSLAKEINKVEISLETLALDTVVSEVLNSEYQSSYERYLHVRKHFDAVVNTILFGDRAIEAFEFYVPNSLQGVRKEFYPLKELEEDPLYAKTDGANVNEWFCENGRLYVYRRIYNTADISRYAVAKAVVKVSSLVDPLVFEDANYVLSLRGRVLSSGVQDPAAPGRLYKSAEAFGGGGQLDIYWSKNALPGANNAVFLLAGVFACTFLLLLSAVYLISGSLSRRLNYVAAELSSIVEHGFESSIAEEYDDEIGQLAKTANQMIRNTKQHIRDVYQSELKQKEYEYKALQAQINPHFLYNTLSIVNWRAIRSDNLEISEIVTKLSKFYATALNYGKQVTTVINELQNIRAYVDIQLYSHNHAFDVEYRIDPNAYGCNMPNHIIQPIVENAIEHGIDHLESGRGYLLIEIALSGGEISIEISNNGPPIEHPELLLQRESRGYGLSNVNKRLELFFEKTYQLSFQNGELTRVLLRFPVVRDA